jgi:DNA-binding MarR family transcriptional regulator
MKTRQDLLCRANTLDADQPVNPHLCQYLSYCLEKTTLKMRGRLQKVWEKNGFIGPQMGILSLLMRTGALNQMELGRQTRIDKASMVKFLDGLEGLGLIKRVNDPHDRRAKLLEVTAKGVKAFRKAVTEVARIEEDFLQDLSATEVRQFRHLLKKLLLG